MADPADAAANSLGLDLDALKIKDNPESSGSAEPPKEDKSSPELESTDASNPEDAKKAEDDAAGDDEARSPTSEGKKDPKKKPYVNPERVKTGGTQRDKLSEEELTARMTRIREQNEKIKQRRLDVQADEDAFKKTQEVDRVKAAKTKKVQENIDRTREQNVRRKMAKIQNREWDAMKPTRDWKRKPEDNDGKPPRPAISIRGAVRGRGAGRGRGRGIASSSSAAENTENESGWPAETDSQWPPTEDDSQWPPTEADSQWPPTEADSQWPPTESDSLWPAETEGPTETKEDEWPTESGWPTEDAGAALWPA